MNINFVVRLDKIYGVGENAKKIITINTRRVKMKKFSLLLVGLLFVTFSMGCGSDEVVEVIDLNRVLDVMTATLDELKSTPVEGVQKNYNKKYKEGKDEKI